MTEGGGWVRKKFGNPPLCNSNHDASKQEQAETSTHEISELTFCVQLVMRYLLTYTGKMIKLKCNTNP